MHCFRILRRITNHYTRQLLPNKVMFLHSNDNMIHPTYTSKYFKVSKSEIIQYLEERKMDFRMQGTYIQLKECPYCPKHNHHDFTNFYTMGINSENGSYNCFRASCLAKGSWFDFRNFMNGTLPHNNQVHATQTPQKLNLFEFHTYHERLKRKEPKEAYQYIAGQNYDMGHRGLTDEVLRHYFVGIDYQEIYDKDAMSFNPRPLVYFPMFRMRAKEERVKIQQRNLKNKSREVFGEARIQPENELYELVSCKVRGAGQDLKHIQRMEPTNAVKGIFGIQLLKPDITQLIITEGEFDAMAAYQMTGIPAISLPNGIMQMPDYLVEWIDQFEHLKDIIVWVDDDEPGRVNAQKMARKLGVIRTRVVQPSLVDPKYYPKDANDALRYCPERALEFIAAATCLLKKNITTLADFRMQTKNRLLNIEASRGVPAQTFHTFNQSTKGLRQGEFTIITGPTGSGKTTFLSQLSLEFCRKGVATLWGSFEIKSDKLAESMLMQAYKTDITKQKQFIDVAMDRFEREIPMFFMNFYGTTDIDQIIDTIEYAIYEYHITHVCLDNLQFMMGTSAQGIRKFEIQDEIIEKFRKLATNNDIHLSLVIHPRKVDENEDLTIASVFGSAKATQEADNVFIIQNRPRYRVFEVKKNRYDGEIGRVGLGFDTNVKSYFELATDEIKSLNEEKATILQIIDKRKLEGKHFKQELTVVDRPPPPEGNDGGNDGGNSTITLNNNWNVLDEEVEVVEYDGNAVIEDRMVSAGEIDKTIEPSVSYNDCWDFDRVYNLEVKEDIVLTQQSDQEDFDDQLGNVARKFQFIRQKK